MATKTSIEWVKGPDGQQGMTWNPVRGCSRISPGCTHCYAERMAARFSDKGKPFQFFADRHKSGSKWTGKVELIPDALDIPLRRKKPTTWFVNSMSDLFHEALPDEDILRVLKAMDKAPRHTYQVLTKRAEWMKRFMRAHLYGKPPRYLWLGVSVEDQKRADERIPNLLATPAAVRFVSVEPMLGPVDLTAWLGCTCEGEFCDVDEHDRDSRLDWVIVGGESGPGARPCNVEWIRSIVRQCRAAKVACFVKQLGANVDGDWPQFPGWDADANGYPIRNRKGGDMAEWPADLRVREMPEVSR